ncbi:hypothetical protein [Dyella sp. C11]|uniref:hypothetical protein n=1 Tax=Dyella sp. C11 TaxID=2126991 RepID=UPI000D649BF8|nr:hypothetical protein [Dyella sp. C11]
MAVHDHTARARLSFPAGDALNATPNADPTAHRPSPYSLRLSTLDDIALAHYALSQLWLEDEKCRTALAKKIATETPAWPLPPLFKEGVSLAIQCLEQHARQLDGKRAMNA